MIEAVATLFFCLVKDDAGNTLHFEKPAKRIVSLAPDLTETLFAAGAGERIVGVVSGSDYPAAANKIAKVGSYSGIDLEKTISLHPDLIVTWGNNFPREISAFKKLGIPVYVSNPARIEDVPRTLRYLGCLAGVEKFANHAADNFSRVWRQLQKQYQTQKPVTVFYQIGDYSLITINKKSWINQVIALCGGRNIFANMTSLSTEVSWESVVMANPEVIITDATNDSWTSRWQRWQSISAVKNNHLYNIPPDLIDRAGPRLLEGAKRVCERLRMARLSQAPAGA